jgi:demethylmenaquinone methyltransferase/2-methoxy-6-polyprenyl-1,4-benzoquinol methylase
VADDVEALLAQQVDYYQARAGEYDQAYAGADNPLRHRDAVLALTPVGGRVLEVACGTGQWTQHLARRFADVTALDTSPGALAIARQRAPAGVRWLQEDVFRFRSDEPFDLVFAAFWVSHVPWSVWPRFWSRLAALLAPGGVVVCVDETADGLAGKETWSSDAQDVVTRSVADGRTFQVAKLRLDPVAVGARLTDLGWAVETVTLSPDLFALRAQSANRHDSAVTAPR